MRAGLAVPPRVHMGWSKREAATVIDDLAGETAGPIDAFRLGIDSQLMHPWRIQLKWAEGDVVIVERMAAPPTPRSRVCLCAATPQIRSTDRR